MEILAPAGSISALKAAIRGGADAVYLGLGEHNARIKSNDFTTDNLSKWVGYAHIFGVKVYVTLNTAVKNEERDRALELAVIAARAGADALIVADLGLAALIPQKVDIPLHLSTQAGVQNSYDARALQGLKIKRVILSRETPINEISEIKKVASEVEIFVQGAICVSFSGGCLLGSKMYGASGNRGLCNQACRLTYSAYDEKGKELKKGKLLSPCDLSLGEKVRSLDSLGVDSVKIEGRLKRAQYVYAATKYYRRLLDGKDTAQDLRDLCESFNRGFTAGYSLKKSASIINPLTSSHIGVEVGVVKKILTRNGYKFAQVESEYRFSKGDGAKILRKGVEVGGSDVTSVKQVGNLQEIPVSDGVAIGDIVCLTTNAEKESFAEKITNTRPVEMEFFGGVGKNVTLTAKSGAISASVQSEGSAQASHSDNNAPIAEKLSKAGGTEFFVERVTDKTEGPIYLNLSEINSMRREVLGLLRERIEEAAKPHYTFFSDPVKALPSVCKTAKKIYEVEELTAEQIYPQADGFVISPRTWDETVAKSSETAGNRTVYLRLPKVLRESELPFVIGFLKKHPRLGVYADNLYAVEIARELKRPYLAGFGLNVFNDDAAKLFDDADLVAGSIEHPYAGDLRFAAGKVRLMSFAHCPFSVVYGTDCATCDKKRDRLLYRTGDHEYLVLRRQVASCDFTMLENKVTYYSNLSDKSAFFSLVGLDKEERKAVIDYGGNR